MAFTFVGLWNLEDEEILVNAYHIMTMQRMSKGSDSIFTEVRLVNGEILTVAQSPTEIRTLMSMNGVAAE